MPEIIAFISPKGGTGSTFACSYVWRALNEKGYKVLALDMCFEQCTLDYALGVQNDYVYTLSDVVCGNCTLEEAVGSCNSGFVRSDYEMDGFLPDRACEIIEETDYDYVLVDVNPRLDFSLQHILNFANRVVLITDCQTSTVALCTSFVRKVQCESKSSVIINKINPYFIRDGIHLTVDEVLDSIGCALLGLVPFDFGSEIILSGKEEKPSDWCSFTKPFDNIAERILGNKVPACDIEALFKDAKTLKYLTRGRK